MAVYPNSECQLFCYWMLNVSWQQLTPPRLSLINTVYTASINGTSVSDNDFNNFTQVTAWRYKYFLIWLTNGGYPSIDGLNYFKNWVIQPSATFKTYVYTFINSCKTHYNWDKIIGLWLFAVPTSDGAIINMRDPYNHSTSIIGTPTFTANQGYTGGDNTKAINTGIAVGNDNRLSQYFCEFGSYSRTNSAAAEIEIGCAEGGGTLANQIYTKFTDNKIYGAVNGGAITATTVADSLALTSIKRLNNYSVTAYKRGVSVITNTNATTGLTKYPFYALGLNAGLTITNPSNRQVSLIYISLPTLDTLSFYNDVQALMTSIGCQV